MSRTVVSTASSPGSLILASRSGTFRRRERLCLTGGRALCSDWGGRRIICSSIAAHPKIFSDGLSSLDRNALFKFQPPLIIFRRRISVSLKLQIHFLCSGKQSDCHPKWNSNHNLIVTHPILSLMESCTTMAQLKQIQSHMTRTGLVTHRFPASRVIAFCALSEDGDMNHARIVFSQIQHPNTYIWNTMLRGYSRWSSSPNLPFAFLREMVRRRVEMDGRSFVFGLKVSERFVGVSNGEVMYGLVCKLGLDSELLVRNGLVHFYTKQGDFTSARKVFDGSLVRDVVTWTTMIDGYAQAGHFNDSMKLFLSMLTDKVEPNGITMIAVLSACSQTAMPRLARSIHGLMETKGLTSGLSLVNALMDMYGKCGCMHIAKQIFDNMLTKDVFSWTSMVNGYAKCGNISDAEKLFNEMPNKNVISWSAMISGYLHCHNPKAALELFQEMITIHKIAPIEATLLTIFASCARTGRLDIGERIYNQYLVHQGKSIPISTKLTNAVIDMYAKCGAIDDAEKLFVKMPRRDVITYNIMILGYAVHGRAKDAISLFEQMKKVSACGITPDAVTYIGVLSACSHGGLVSEGQRQFDNMMRCFNITPKAEHYTCMIDLYGRVGFLEDAEKLIKSMPMEVDKAGWGALLSASRIHGNVELGELAGRKLLELDSGDSGVYSMISNMYADVNESDGVMTIRRLMRNQGVRKCPGCSSIEIDDDVHEFFASDRSHSLSEKIRVVLDEIYLHIKLER